MHPCARLANFKVFLWKAALPRSPPPQQITIQKSCSTQRRTTLNLFTGGAALADWSQALWNFLRLLPWSKEMKGGCLVSRAHKPSSARRSLGSARQMWGTTPVSQPSFCTTRTADLVSLFFSSVVDALMLITSNGNRQSKENDTKKSWSKSFTT